VRAAKTTERLEQQTAYLWAMVRIAMREHRDTPAIAPADAFAI
jgi:hypothetical protein